LAQRIPWTQLGERNEERGRTRRRWKVEIMNVNQTINERITKPEEVELKKRSKEKKITSEGHGGYLF
jgi:hypothetical protein